MIYIHQHGGNHHQKSLLPLPREKQNSQQQGHNKMLGDMKDWKPHLARIFQSRHYVEISTVLKATIYRHANENGAKTFSGSL